MEAKGSKGWIDDYSIQNCSDIEYLDVSGNTNIADINHLTNLQILKINKYYHQSKLCDDGITRCTKLSELYLLDNNCVTDISKFTELKKIYISRKTKTRFNDSRKNYQIKIINK
jgi:hypothetical protein